MIRVSITASRAKTANARRDPRVSLYVAPSGFSSYVVVGGQRRADTACQRTRRRRPSTSWSTLYRAVAGEHDDWDDYRRAMVADGRLVLRLRPERAYGMLPD